MFRGVIDLEEEQSVIDQVVVPQEVSAPVGGFPTTVLGQDGYFDFDIDAEEFRNRDEQQRGLGRELRYFKGIDNEKLVEDGFNKYGDIPKDLLELDLRVNKPKNTKNVLVDLPQSLRRLRLAQLEDAYGFGSDALSFAQQHLREAERRTYGFGREGLRDFIGFDSLARRTIPRFYDLLGSDIRGKRSDKSLAEEPEPEELYDYFLDVEGMTEEEARKAVEDEPNKITDPDRQRDKASKAQIDKIGRVKRDLRSVKEKDINKLMFK